MLHLSSPGVCPEEAIKPSIPEWPRGIQTPFSAVVAAHKVTGIPGRVTEEMKTNDITERYGWGEAGFCVELGRPAVGTSFKEAEKISTLLARKGVEFKKQKILLLKNKSAIRVSFSTDF